MGNLHRSNREPWEREADEPPDSEGESRDARTSGIVARRRPEAPAEIPTPDGPCTDIGQIYKRYQRFVWSMLDRPDISPESAPGIHTEAFLKADQVIHDDGLQGSVAGLLASITEHLICNYLRVRGRRPRIDHGADAEAVPASQPGADLQLCSAEARHMVANILARLPEKDAQLIRWIDLGQLPIPEVAGMLDLNVSTVKTQHRRALGKFKAAALRLYKADLEGDK